MGRYERRLSTVVWRALEELRERAGFTLEELWGDDVACQVNSDPESTVI